MDVSTRPSRKGIHLGFGIPLDQFPAFEHSYAQKKRTRFPIGALAYEYRGLAVTVREQAMLDMMESLTNKPEWRRKVFDMEIVAKWRAEIVRHSARQRSFFSDRMFDYCIDELRDKAKQHEDTGIVRLLDIGAAVVSSDTLVPEELRVRLIEAVKPLEDVPERERDWHPRSDNTVLDLVHPSLFPLVFGVSRVLTEHEVRVQDCISMCGKGEVIPVPIDDHKRYDAFISRKFQWLPSDVSFEGGGVKINSYVNNLHPVTHARLYPLLEELIARAIHLWNETLSSVTHTETEQRLRIRDEETAYEWPKGYFEDRERQEGEPDSDDDDYWEFKRQWERENRVLVQPEPEDYDSDRKFFEEEKPPPAPVDLRAQFPNGIQVIVKLANIHLTPQKPNYQGGSWHIEGFVNEHICSTALYYYDCENITDSYLAFRQNTDNEDMVLKAHDQNDWEGAAEIYGVEHEGPGVQPIGSILTRQSRFLAFPNIFQHRVAPFSLADRSKPGHRKIVALFLVDPYIRVLSTANVPPQRRDWWADEVMKNGALERLPKEMVHQIVDNVDDFPISVEKAKEMRLELMAERTGYDTRVNEKFEEERFSFCEH